MATQQTSNKNTSASGQGSSADRRPARWQEILERGDSQMPFKGLFDEAFGQELTKQRDERGEERAMRFESRIVEPVEGWETFFSAEWGADSLFVEDWFDEGEALQHSELEVTIDEPDWLERSWSWFRTLFMETRLRPA